MEEVIEIKKQLEKINSNKDKCDKHLAIDLLKRLEAVPMSLEVLSKTGIGKIVYMTRKSIEDPTVGSLCKGMVKRWKGAFVQVNSSSNNNHNSSSSASIKDKDSHRDSHRDSHKDIGSTNHSGHNNNNNGNNGNGLNNNDNTNTTTASGNNVTSSNTNSSSSAHQSGGSSGSAPASSSSSTTVSSRAPQPQVGPSTTDGVRLKSRQLLCDALKKPFNNEHDEEALLEPEPLADSIEEAIYQEFRRIDMKYKNRIRSRVLNLGDVKNPFLRLNVRRGDIKTDRIAKMTAEEMASDELKEKRAQFTKEAINDHQMAVTGGTKTSEIKCPACKKCNCTYNQVQTRSADEPMTTFCFCNECGKRWKFC